MMLKDHNWTCVQTYHVIAASKFMAKEMKSEFHSAITVSDISRSPFLFRLLAAA